MVVDLVGRIMASKELHRMEIEAAASTLAYEQGVDEAKAELERIAQQLDQ